jgi:hypothetical protein
VLLVLSLRTAYVAGFYETPWTRKRLRFSRRIVSQAQASLAGCWLDRLFTRTAMIARMKAPQQVALRLVALVVISVFATALYNTMTLEETITVSWRGEAKAPDLIAGWATFALGSLIGTIVGIGVGYRAADGSPRNLWLSTNTPIIASAAFTILGLVVYSQMTPVSDIRIPDDLRSRVFQNLFAYGSELMAQLLALMGVGATVRRFLASDERLKDS